MGGFTMRELADLEKLVAANVFKVKGAERIRLLVILRKLEAERLRLWALGKY